MVTAVETTSTDSIFPSVPQLRKVFDFRVFVGRIMVGLAVVLAGYFGINPPGFVAQVVAFAFGLAAASFFPAIVLGIFDKRTNREGAIAGSNLSVRGTAKRA